MAQRAFLAPVAGLTLLVLAGCGSGEGPSSGAGAAGGASGSDVTSGPAGGREASEPFVAEPETWTWVPIEGAFCADGSPTGIGVSLSKKSSRLVVYFMGGGACWSEASCTEFRTALHLGGYDGRDFEAEIGLIGATAPFRRDDETNPFKDDSYVFIPYCTGDVHGGRRVATYGGEPFHHVGFENLTRALPRLRATFEAPERVVVTGSSAGGIGAGFNFWRFKELYPAARAYLLDDSGPPLPPPYLSAEREGAWRAAWNLDATLPEDCADCGERLDALLDHYAVKYAGTRMALLSYTHDSVISAFYGISGPDFYEGLKELADEHFDGTESFRYFYDVGGSHVMLATPKTVSQGGTSLWKWIGLMVQDDPAWKSVHP